MPTMAERVLISFIGTLPATIFAIASLIQAIRTHRLVNSGMAARDNSMKAQGRIEEQQIQQNEQKDK